MIEESTPGGVVYYVREPGGSLIARVKGTDTHYYHFDSLGSTRMITDSGGSVTDAYAYDAYGSLISHDRYTGSIDQPYQYVGRLGYYTHYSEPEFSLLQLGVRFYDAEVGRFTQRDPAKDGINWYAYVEGRPLVAVDPSGLKGEAIFGDGQLCIDSSCSNWCTPWIQYQADFGGPNGGPLIAPRKGMKCVNTDAIIVPVGVPVIGDGITVPKRPSGQDRLKISGGVRCTISCSQKKGKLHISLTCKRYSSLRRIPFWYPPVEWK